MTAGILMTKPDAAILDGNRIGIFIGSGYRMLTVEQAEALCARLAELVAAAKGRAP